MEFNERLQKLRLDAHLTQEELAEKLYVSRTAISKWESGRGYPSIDSLKAIAAYFHVTIDELIRGGEIVTIAEHEKKGLSQDYFSLICGMLDCLSAILLFLPVFGDGGKFVDGSREIVRSVSLLSLTPVSYWLKIAFITIIGLTAANGFCAVALAGFDKTGFDKTGWSRRCEGIGLALSVAATLLFMLVRQPYAGTFCLCLLVIKGFLAVKIHDTKRIGL